MEQRDRERMIDRERHRERVSLSGKKSTQHQRERKQNSRSANRQPFLVERESSITITIFPWPSINSVSTTWIHDWYSNDKAACISTVKIDCKAAYANENVGLHLLEVYWLTLSDPWLHPLQKSSKPSASWHQWLHPLFWQQISGDS